MDGLVFGDEADAVEALLDGDEVAAGPDDTGVGFDGTGVAAFAAGGGVRPRFVGRGMCRVF